MYLYLELGEHFAAIFHMALCPSKNVFAALAPATDDKLEEEEKSARGGGQPLNDKHPRLGAF